MGGGRLLPHHARFTVVLRVSQSSDLAHSPDGRAPLALLDGFAFIAARWRRVMRALRTGLADCGAGVPDSLVYSSPGKAAGPPLRPW
jgi:hypothetical protein